MSEIFKGTTGNDEGWEDLGNEETEGRGIQDRLENGETPAEILAETYGQGILTRDLLDQLIEIFNKEGFYISPEKIDEYTELANQGINPRSDNTKGPEIGDFERSA